MLCFTNYFYLYHSPEKIKLLYLKFVRNKTTSNCTGAKKNGHSIFFFRCDGERMCAMPVSSEVFGDPCPNTRKYVEVHFACMPKIRTTTTKRPLPPWFLQVN